MSEIKKKDYETELEGLQRELVGLQRWLTAGGQRMLILFEGRDAAGKGGVIKAISEPLNTRSTRIVALSKPDERERTQWYYQRYIEHLPAAGELVLFDRSWYNRAGVEQVMGFCSDAEYQRFLNECPIFERALINDGILLVKYWLAVDQTQQEERFHERAEDPLKRWKISPIDLAAREKYREYGKARDVMFQHTHTKQSPWHVVNFNDQRRGRLNLIRHLLDCVPERAKPDKSLKLPKLKHDLGKERLSDKRLWVRETY